MVATKNMTMRDLEEAFRNIQRTVAERSAKVRELQERVSVLEIQVRNCAHTRKGDEDR